MWEKGVCIYGTPRVYNNFPIKSMLHLEEEEKIIIIIIVVGQNWPS